MLVRVLLFLWLCSTLAAAEPVAGALAPLAPTTVELEHLVVRYDLIGAGPSRARVRMDASLYNPSPAAERAELVLLAPNPVVQLDGVSIPTETVKTRNREATTFVLQMGPQARQRLTARFEVPSAAARSGGREFLYRMPGSTGWPGFQSATLLVLSRKGWELATHPPTALLSSGPDEVVYGVSLGPNQTEWLKVVVTWKGLPILFWVVGVPAVVSLAAGSLALTWPGPPAVRALFLAYLLMAPAFLWMRSSGLLAWIPGALPTLLCWVLGPVLAAAYAVLASREKLDAPKEA